MKVVVITGGSGGIGLALCREFCSRGDKVYSLSRNKNTENPAVHITADVSDDVSVKAAFAQIEEDHIDLLINNAGFGISGAIEFTEISEAEKQFQVNFFGGLRCVQAAIPLLRKCRGRIINVSSAAAIFSIPFQAFYSASKAAVNSLTLALRNELYDFDISVCAVMPGDVKTGFTQQRRKSNEGSDLYQDKIEASIAVMEKDEQNGMTPEYVARYIRRIAGKRSVAPLYSAGLLYKFFALLNKILPQRLVNRIVRIMYIKKKK